MIKKTAIVLFVSMITACDQLQNWGAAYRQPKAEKMADSEVAKWENDLRLSKDRARELHKDIHSLVSESNLQGVLSWKIAKAYMNAGRYDLAGRHFTAAMGQGTVNEDEEVRIHLIEKTLPMVREALNRNAPDPDLMFDAGVCFANASRVMGWDEDRWRTAVLIFQKLMQMSPNDLRAPYELALLYGKVGKDSLRDMDTSMKLFDVILKKDPNYMPALFARAHILAEQGDMERSLQEYLKIKERIESLTGAGSISTPLGKNQQYAQVQANIDVISGCLRKDDTKKCEILGYE
ncbi:MAG: hypothetical protein HY042_07790 [Spirochaetia bacterium]|nr:hypothetical protein [Spirochaetia bacterium]